MKWLRSEVIKKTAEEYKPMLEWDEDERGFVMFKALIRFETALLAKIGCGVRIEFTHQPQDIEIENKQGAIQLSMTPKQAFELAEALGGVASHAMDLPSGAVPS